MQPQVININMSKFQEIFSRFGTQTKSLPFTIVNELKAKAQFFKPNETKSSTQTNGLKIDVEMLDYMVKKSDIVENAKNDVKLALIKHYFVTNESELELIDGISEYPLLWEKIETELPQVASFFYLQSEQVKNEVQTSVTPIQNT